MPNTNAFFSTYGNNLIYSRIGKKVRCIYCIIFMIVFSQNMIVKENISPKNFGILVMDSLQEGIQNDTPKALPQRFINRNCSITQHIDITPQFIVIPAIYNGLSYWIRIIFLYNIFKSNEKNNLMIRHYKSRRDDR